MMLLVLSLLSLASAQNCIGRHGTSVDWWFILKLPYDSKAALTGMEYYYCDAENDCASLDLMPLGLNDHQSPLVRTAGQLNFADTDSMHITWSDQPYQKSTVSNKAHSKGMLSASLNGKAFVINHSTPNFPLFDEAYERIIDGMPDSSTVYGQHYMCLELTTQELDNIAHHYRVAEVIVNKANLVSGFEGIFPNIFSLKDNSRSPPDQSGHFITQTRGGLKFHVISTNQNFQSDFYATLVAPSIKVGLVVETWGNGPGGLSDPNCGTYQTFSNLRRSHLGYEFKYTKDHSKFGISLNPNSPYVCMSDINRQESQNRRGGTSFCFLNKNLWRILDGMFVERQSC